MRFRVTRKPYNKKKIRRRHFIRPPSCLCWSYHRRRRITIITIIQPCGVRGELQTGNHHDDSDEQVGGILYRCNISACVYTVVEYIFDAVTSVQTRVIKHFITYM